MSEAIALQATEQARDLVANPHQWGIKKREGLEPLDVVVKFNRAASHTRSAFQVVVSMKLSWDNGGSWSEHAGLVAEGKTKGEALECFYNWMADDDAVATFHEVVRTAELDALAKQAQAEAAAESRDAASRAKGFNQTWLDRKLHEVGKKLGLKKDKVQVS